MDRAVLLATLAIALAGDFALTEELRESSKSDVKRRSVLVGGSVAASGRYPYFVSLRSPESLLDYSHSPTDGSGSSSSASLGQDQYQHFCGASLISDWLVLTAAHCVPDLPAAQSSAFKSAGLNFTSLPNTYRPTSGDGNVSAFIGASKLDLGSAPGNPIVLWFVHPWFDSYTYQYDVAIGLLSKPDRTTPKAKLQDGSKDVYGAFAATQQISAIGMGNRIDQDGSEYLLIHNSSYIDLDQDPTEQLEEVELGTLVSRQTCGRALTNDSVVPVLRGNGNVVNASATIISAGQFCIQANAAAPSQPEIIGQRGNYTVQAIAHYPDTCQGDSGSPIYLKGQSANDDLQIGIVSFGDGCGRNLPSVYTSTGAFMNATRFDSFLFDIIKKVPNSLAASN